MSVGNTTQAVNFDRKDLTLVLGHNLDLGGDDTGARNGTGKTTIINALSYALFGSALTNIKKDNLINKINEKNMLVTIEFEKDGVDYKVERGRKPNTMAFYIADQAQEISDESQGDSRETQAEIDRVLGFSHDMFKHIVALNTYTEPFLSLKAADQRDIIEQLLGITVLSEKAELLKEQLRATKELITAEEYRIKAVGDANTGIQEQITKMQVRQSTWRSKKELDCAQLVTAFVELNQIDIDSELQAHKDLANYQLRKTQSDTRNTVLMRQNIWKQKIDKELSALQVNYEKLSHIDISAELFAHKALALWNTQSTRIAELNKWINLCEIAMTKETKIIEKLQQEIADLKEHKCYACGQEVHDSTHEEILASKETALKDAALQLLSTNGQWIEHTGIVKEIGDIGIKPSCYYATEQEAFEHQNKLATLEDQLIKKMNEVSPYADQLVEHAEIVLGDKPTTIYKTEMEAIEHRSTLKNLEDQIAAKDEEIDPYAEQIEEMTANALQDIDYNIMNGLVRTREHQDFLLKLLTNKDSFVRKRIIDQNLTYLNSRLSQYLDRIGLPHVVNFQNDLSVNIEYNGRELDFDNLSRGERNRLILSLSWAFRDVWESLYQPINLLFIDEVIDTGMDSSGVENALSILKKMARDGDRSVWLVSHKDELAGRVNNVLSVIKESGFTTYNTDVEIS